jgi:hypothetical protein
MPAIAGSYRPLLSSSRMKASALLEYQIYMLFEVSFEERNEDSDSGR